MNLVLKAVLCEHTVCPIDLTLGCKCAKSKLLPGHSGETDACTCYETHKGFTNNTNIQVVTQRQCTNRLYGNMFIGSCYRVALNSSCSCNNE